MKQLQFITHRNEMYNYLECAELALKGGCKWIQLRMKDADKKELLENAVQLRKMCREYDAVLIIDDHADIALQADADGVHLGKNDMDPVDARKLLGQEKIIGGTANTFDDIEILVSKGVDYIGLGPFRFTQTKKNLSSLLGIGGYEDIFDAYRKKGIHIPIVGIGGIEYDDIPALLSVGLSGIAMSSAILNQENPQREVERIMCLM